MAIDLKIPVHVGIIMDGNGRWAKKRFLPRTFGHKQGTENVRKIVKYAKSKGVRHLTLYAFSNENWKRDKSEVDALMDLFILYMKNEIAQLANEGVKVDFIGDLEGLPENVRAQMVKTMEIPVEVVDMNLHIAVNYGSRLEITSAVKAMLKAGVDPDSVTEQTVSDYLYTSGIPDPDFIIRTSGELRLSNFLLYQSAYAEYYFTDVLWPDFDEKEFDKAVESYSTRNRRFGGI